ncbi:hypothetical protein PVAP13_5KG269007 [Panicum virgatum]|uniref:Uncharacterized protein n=1 Tax=Panicum virgatum TaxID=38727 RepID=A0A8T0SWA0_PANVG|nr:hypothetical protein PVAP13_5KG269007 [Panicum virgatum]
MPRGRRSAARNFWRGGPVEVRDGTGMAEVPDPHRHAAATPPHMQGAQAAVRRSISSRGGEAGHQYPARRRRHPPPTCSRRSSATPCPSEGRLAEKLSATASVHPDALNLLLSYVSLLQATFGSKRY